MGISDEGKMALELTLAARMGSAAMLGFPIGLERDFRGKSAGERRFAIVAFGAAAFAGVASSMFPDTAGQAVAGVESGPLGSASSGAPRWARRAASRPQPRSAASR